MLAMKTICERCRTCLDNAAATICSYECTFCIDCSRRWTTSARTAAAS
ncbi:DUF1272 domain-containing protein [Rhodococcus sp. D-1]|nr:DUF1272 domain-containing protein [Rhodococcus sp. D-1]